MQRQRSGISRKAQRCRRADQTAPPALPFEKNFTASGRARLHAAGHVRHGSLHTCSSCNQLLPVRPAAPVYWISASIGATRASTPSTLLSQANMRRAVSFRHPCPRSYACLRAGPRCDWDAARRTCSRPLGRRKPVFCASGKSATLPYPSRTGRI
jgi:hypothetical protein